MKDYSDPLIDLSSYEHPAWKYFTTDFIYDGKSQTIGEEVHPDIYVTRNIKFGGYNFNIWRITNLNPDSKLNRAYRLIFRDGGKNIKAETRKFVVHLLRLDNLYTTRNKVILALGHYAFSDLMVNFTFLKINKAMKIVNREFSDYRTNTAHRTNTANG